MTHFIDTNFRTYLTITSFSRSLFPCIAPPFLFCIPSFGTPVFFLCIDILCSINEHLCLILCIYIYSDVSKNTSHILSLLITYNFFVLNIQCRAVVKVNYYLLTIHGIYYGFCIDGKCSCNEDCTKTGSCQCDSSCQCKQSSKFFSIVEIFN